MTSPHTNPRLALALVSFTVLGAMLVAPSATAGMRTTSPPSPGELAHRMLELVNRARDHQGLPVLRMHAHLAAEARHHSTGMASDGALSHTPNLDDLVRDAGGTVFGEDLGKGRGLQGIWEAWLHRANTRQIVLDPRFHHVGLGVVHVGGYYWVTFQAFD